MIRDLTTVIQDLKGKPLKEGNEDMTAAAVTSNALLAPFPNDTAGPTEKSKRFKLAMRIIENPARVEINSDEMTMIKDMVARVYITLVYGRIEELLEHSADLKAVEAK
jgi:hypothetical protein